MKNPMRFLPAPLRLFTTSAVMIGVLAGSLLLASALVAARRRPRVAVDRPTIKLRLIRVGDLQLNIPEQFLLSDQFEPPGDSIDAAMWLVDKSAPGRTLFVGGIRTHEPRAPHMVLKRMLPHFVPPQILAVQPQLQDFRFRSRRLVGAYYDNISETSQGDQLNLLAVLTEDGRRYWVISLSHLIKESEGAPKALDISRQLMSYILGFAEGDNLRNAQSEDFFAVGLGPWHAADPSLTQDDWLPSGLRTRIGKNSRGQDPILVFPNDPLDRLRLLRLRGVIDPEGLGPDPQLTPKSLLSTQFEFILDRLLTDEEIWSGHIVDTPVWHTPVIQSHQALARQIWYAQLGHGRGMLIEILCEPTALAITTAWVAPLIQAAQARVENAAGMESAESIWHSALAHGKSIAQQQNMHLTQQTEDQWDFFLIMRDYRLFGAQMAHVSIETPNDSLPVRGHTKTILSAERVDEQWRASVDGSRYLTTRQWTIPTSRNNGLDVTREVASTEHMQIENNRITFDRQTIDGQRDKQWSASSPNAFVGPWAEESWPMEYTPTEDAAESLIWMTRSSDPPRPYWIRLFANTSMTSETESSPKQPTQEMWIRPLMSLDTDRLTFNDQGKMLTYETSRLDGWARGVLITALRVDERTAMTAFPTLASESEPGLQNGVSEP